MSSSDLSLQHHWMPFTNNRDFKADPKMVYGAEGIWLTGADGRKILDGSSGLFTTPAGHGRKRIADAVHRQMIELDYISSFTRGHEPSFRLADRLAAMLPPGIDRIFFVNSGSESVDTAMKICLAYHAARGDGDRKMFVSRERAYHGMNFGGLSLAGMVRNRLGFGTGLPGIVHMRHTGLPEHRFVLGEPAQGAELADDLQRMVDTYGADSIAACVVEPIAGSTGVLVPPRGYLQRLRAICDRHGILLVFDEVICGFGRTGKAFGAQSFGVTPDIITMAKALTNGALPMGAVAVRQNIQDTIMAAAPENAIEFMHGYTASAHPAACAAALAALDIYEEENLFERAAQMSAYFLDTVAGLRDLPSVTDIRGYGMLAGIDLAAGTGPGAGGYMMQKRLFDAGLHVKITGDTIILAPPFTVNGGEIDQMRDILHDVLAAEQRAAA
ncbi:MULTISPECIES: aminotransferase class III-fold pyridoxal phosphate-dependent enzyme [Acidiphilium]|uniref:Aminotransferase class III-fold pyridoxal phosphate-dependent enzyme n=1 Tax=Acidiphilium iwatense TaxID=768198 RepID=A0ABS9DZQ5_9PROT|nr:MULTISPECIES: aminotransferase class III-fold pyridoxal phosphate-dependent enzyme [Acidiphilium]MCF3946917.1 aminotransferase class III-fold pyridoxal phosphate-dependent enzyme [Acidiphilium iwatense]